MKTIKKAIHTVKAQTPSEKGASTKVHRSGKDTSSVEHYKAQVDSDLKKMAKHLSTAKLKNTTGY